MVTIFIVEDDKNCRLVLTAFAIKSAHTPIVASNGFEGLQEWNNNTIDLVITDIDMPKMTGLDLLKQINGKAKVIVVTSNKDQYCDKAISLGALEVLEKPVSLTQFKELMDRYT